MEQILRRISVTNDFPSEHSITRGFDGYVEWIASIYLGFMGKYRIKDTGLIELSYLHDKPKYFSCRIGVSVLRTGNIAKFFDIEYFMSLKNDVEQRGYITNDIFERLRLFADKYSLPMKPLYQAHSEALKSDYFLDVDSFITKDRSIILTVKNKRNIENTFDYKINVKYKKQNRTKEFRVCTVPIITQNVIPNISIDKFIGIVPTFIIEGIKDDKNLIMKFGGVNKLLHEEYIFNIETEKMETKILKK